MAKSKSVSKGVMTEKLSIKGLALTGAILWGGAVLGLILLNAEFPGYGVSALNVVASIYPGYTPFYSGGGWWSIPIGTLYGVVDGAAVGTIFALLYNKLR